MSNSEFLQWQETFGEYVSSGIRTMYAARVESYNYQTRKANIKILGSFEKDIDEYEEISILTDVPVGMPVGGGFFISLPIKQNDLGRLCIFSQDIDAYKSFGGILPTDSNHNFNYHNSIFIPDFNPFNKSIPNHDENNLVIGNIENGMTFILTPDKECIIEQDGEYKFKIESNGDVRIKNNLIVEGNISAPTGEISDILGSMNEIRNTYNSHTHPGVTTGAGYTLAPLLDPME